VSASVSRGSPARPVTVTSVMGAAVYVRRDTGRDFARGYPSPTTDEELTRRCPRP
jgi:hypothetical protein